MEYFLEEDWYLSNMYFVLCNKTLFVLLLDF